jgi:N-acetylglucosamine-6-sulfatase
MTEDNAKPVYHAGKYSNDLVTSKSVRYLNHALASKKPFFLVAAPIGPHAEKAGSEDDSGKMPAAAKRHQGLFQDFIIPRNDDFNPPTVRITPSPNDDEGRGANSQPAWWCCLL